MMESTNNRIHFLLEGEPEKITLFPPTSQIRGSVLSGITITDLGVSVVRDRVGYKSFYYLIENTDLYISDKISRIALARDLQLEINNDSLCELLSYRYISGERTLFNYISKIPAGYLYRFFPGSTKWVIVSSRSDYFNFEPDLSITTKIEFRRKFSTLFENSVNSLSSSSTSIFFSGGLDSSLIAAIMKAGCTGYCAGVDNTTYDESSYALTAAKDIGIQTNIAKITSSNFLSSVREVISKTETSLPVIQLAMYNDLLKNSGIPKGIIVAGYGADYILGESQRKYWAALRIGLSIPQWVLRTLVRVLSVSGERRKEQAEKLYLFLSGIKAGQTWNSLIPSLDPPSSSAISARALGLSSIPDIHSHRRRLLGDETPLYITQQVFVTYSNLISATLSAWASLCSSYGLDLKTPFLDNSLVNMITSTKPNLYLSLTSGKPAIYLLAKKILPKHLIERPKKSSLLPPKFWLNERTPGLTELFDDIRSRNIVDIDYLLNREGAFSRYGYIPVWSAINMEILFQFYESKGFVIQ